MCEWFYSQIRWKHCSNTKMYMYAWVATSLIKKKGFHQQKNCSTQNLNGVSFLFINFDKIIPTMYTEWKYNLKMKASRMIWKTWFPVCTDCYMGGKHGNPFQLINLTAIIKH